MLVSESSLWMRAADFFKASVWRKNNELSRLVLPHNAHGEEDAEEQDDDDRDDDGNFDNADSHWFSRGGRNPLPPSGQEHQPADEDEDDQ